MKERLEKHAYELPCVNCKALVKLTPENWLKHYRGKTLPFCKANGCNKYKKFLSVDGRHDGYYE